MRPYFIVVAFATAMTSYAVFAKAEMMTLRCHGIAIQNACNAQEICIDDPRGLSKDFRIGLSLAHRSYRSGARVGKIAFVDLSSRRGLQLSVDPAIEGGTRIELSPDRKTAKLMGGDSNYFLRCH